jgi:nicotinamidase-related amidase
MRIEKKDSVLVVVDIQERLFPHIYNHEILEKNCNILIAGMKVLDVPILVSEQYSKALGHTISSVRETLGDHLPMEKICFSCCGEELFLNHLKQLGKKHIILCGVESHICVLQTALDFQEIGFQVVIIEDCVGSRKPNDKLHAVERMRQAGVIISTYESILFELCQVAGTDQFKAISKLVK